MQTDTSPTPNTSPARKTRLFFSSRRIGAALAIFLVLVGGYFLWKKLVRGNDNLSNYQIASVQRGDIEDLVTATGTLQPRDYVDIGAQVSGQLKKIHVETGSIVQAGDLLAEIDPTVFLANVDARRASLRNLQATLLDRQAQLSLAELQYTRQKNLTEGDASTLESLQSAEASQRSAKAQLLALKAQIEQTESTLRADEANLNYAKIYAPISGVVVSITARQGATLNANQSAPIILRIADLSKMTVQTQVSEADVSRLSPDMEAYFTTLGNRGQRWYGKLTKVEPTPTVTNNVVLYNALFDVPNDERRLLPQMTAQVFFVAASAKDTLFIPAAAINAKIGDKNDKGSKGEKNGNGGKFSQNAGGSDKPAGAGAQNGSQDNQDRRARFANMSEEEREAARAARRAQNGQNGQNGQREQNGDQPQRGRDQQQHNRPGQDSKSDSEKGTADRNGSGKPSDKSAGDKKSAPKDTATVWAGVAPQVRKGGGEVTIKVVNADGKIEDRKITTGVTNRIQIQVLSGLEEGDQVVIGLKPPPGAPSAQSGQSGQSRDRTALQPQGNIPGMGGGGPR